MTAVPIRSNATVAAELLESEAAYFDAAALTERLEGAVLSRLPGLEALPAAGVVHRIGSAGIGAPPETWLASVETWARTAGLHRVRLYLTHSDPKLERLLRARHYRARHEVGLARPTGGEVLEADRLAMVHLEEVVDLAGWDDKRRVHEASPTQADGHRAEARTWCEMEQRRSAHGYMRPFLIRHGETVVGTLCMAPRGSLLRLKNLLVHPGWRGRGMGTAAVAAAVVLARRAGFATVGCFAIPGGPGLEVYQRTGFRPTVTQVEWIK